MLKKDFGVISAMVLSLFIQRRHTVQAQNLTQKYFQTTSEYHFIQQCACPLSQYTAHSVTCPEGAFPEEPLDGWCRSQGGLEENILEQGSDDFLLGHF